MNNRDDIKKNVSESVLFLLDGATKRRKVALGLALKTRGDYSIKPNLVAVK